jgi:DNA-binding CsgD family transcriptional regulator
MLAACHLAGDIARATQWCRVADEFMRDFTCPFLFARCRVHYGSLLFTKGQWDRAEGELRAALELAEDAGPGPRVEALTQLAELRIRQDRLEEAEELLSGCDGVDAAALAAAELLIARGDPAVAAQLLERYISGRRDDAGRALALLVDAHVASGDAESATAAASKLQVLARADGGERQTALAVLASARAMAARGERDRLVPLLEDTVARFSKLELPFEAARARLELALTVARAHPTTAITEAKMALRAFERIGATAYASRASALLRSLGEAVRPTTTGAEVLTNREKEVLALVGLGLSNPEIAERLFISRKTAAHHVSHLLTKLGLRNRAELAAHAVQMHGRWSGGP